MYKIIWLPIAGLIALTACKNEIEIDKAVYQEVTISLFDKSLTKSMPSAKLRLDTFEIQIDQRQSGLNDFKILLNTGMHNLKILDLKSRVLHEENIDITPDKALLWINYTERPNLEEYNSHLTYHVLLDSLISLNPGKSGIYVNMKRDFFLEGLVSDSLLINERPLFDAIRLKIDIKKSEPDLNSFPDNGFEILYHQKLIL